MLKNLKSLGTNFVFTYVAMFVSMITQQYSEKENKNISNVDSPTYVWHQVSIVLCVDLESYKLTDSLPYINPQTHTTKGDKH